MAESRAGWLVREPHSALFRSMRRWKRRWFVLKGGTLSCYVQQAPGDEGSPDSREFSIDLALQSTVVQAEPAPGGQQPTRAGLFSSSMTNMFMFSIRTPECIFYLCADTSAARQDWIDAIRQAQRELERTSALDPEEEEKEIRLAEDSLMKSRLTEWTMQGWSEGDKAELLDWTMQGWTERADVEDAADMRPATEPRSERESNSPETAPNEDLEDVLAEAEKYKRNGDYTQSVAKYEHAIDILLRLGNDGTSEAAAIYKKIGIIFKEQTNSERALGALQTCLAIELSLYGDSHPSVAITRSIISTVFEALDNCEAALEERRLALEILLQEHGAIHADVGHCRFAMGALYLSLFKFTRARTQYRKAHAIFLRIFGIAHEYTIEAKELYGTLSEYPLYEGDLDSIRANAVGDFILCSDSAGASAELSDHSDGSDESVESNCSNGSSDSPENIPDSSDSDPEDPLLLPYCGPLFALRDLPARPAPGLRGAPLRTKGACGSVFNYSIDGASYVLKTMPKGSFIMFEREVALLVKCRHKNIVRIFDFGCSGEEVWFQLERFNGDLNDVVEARKWAALTGGSYLSAAEIRHIVVSLVRALDYLHNTHGVAHRDLKPDNVLVMFSTAGSLCTRVALTDFGLASPLERALKVRAGVGAAPSDDNKEVVTDAALKRTATEVGDPKFDQPSAVPPAGGDFVEDAGGTAYQDLVGLTPGWAPPELVRVSLQLQMRSPKEKLRLKYDPMRSDMFTLGLVVHFVLTSVSLASFARCFWSPAVLEHDPAALPPLRYPGEQEFPDSLRKNLEQVVAVRDGCLRFRPRERLNAREARDVLPDPTPRIQPLLEFAGIDGEVICIGDRVEIKEMNMWTEVESKYWPDCHPEWHERGTLVGWRSGNWRPRRGDIGHVVHAWVPPKSRHPDKIVKEYRGWADTNCVLVQVDQPDSSAFFVPIAAHSLAVV